MVEGEAPGVIEIEVTTVSEEGTGSPPTVDQSFMGTVAGPIGGVCLGSSL
jgi:hypothetical protein